MVELEVQDKLLMVSEKLCVHTSFQENHNSFFLLYRVAATYLEDIDGLSMVIEVSRLIQGHHLSKSRNSNPSIQSHVHPLGCLNLSRDFRTSRFDPAVCRALQFTSL